MKKFNIYKVDYEEIDIVDKISAIGNYEALKIFIEKLNFKRDSNKIKDSDIFIHRSWICFNDGIYQYRVYAVLSKLKVKLKVIK